MAWPPTGVELRQVCAVANPPLRNAPYSKPLYGLLLWLRTGQAGCQSGVCTGKDEGGVAKYDARIMYAIPTPGLAEVEPSMNWNPSVVAGIGVVADPAVLYQDMHSYLASSGDTPVVVPLLTLGKQPLPMAVHVGSRMLLPHVSMWAACYAADACLHMCCWAICVTRAACSGAALLWHGHGVCMCLLQHTTLFQLVVLQEFSTS